MTKETISTFLPIVNIGIRAKSVKSKAANPEIKLLKISVLFLQPIRYHVIDSLQSCMSITWDVWPLVPLLVRCVVSFSYNWIAFLKSSSSFDFEQWKKRSQRRREIVINGRSICHSWQCFQLAFLGTWKVTVSAQSEQFSTKVPFFSVISFLVITWKILYLFKQPISYRLVFIIWFCPDHNHRKGVIKIRLRAVSYFSLDMVECEHARGAKRNEGWLVYFSHCIGVLVLVFLLSSNSMTGFAHQNYAN